MINQENYTHCLEPGNVHCLGGQYCDPLFVLGGMDTDFSAPRVVSIELFLDLAFVHLPDENSGSFVYIYTSRPTLVY